MDKFGLIYFVDGTMIRRIDQNGIISTVLGSNDLTSARPLSCDSVMDISQVRRCFGWVSREQKPMLSPICLSVCLSGFDGEVRAQGQLHLYVFCGIKMTGSKERSYKDSEISGKRDFKDVQPQKRLLSQLPVIWEVQIPGKPRFIKLISQKTSCFKPKRPGSHTHFSRAVCHALL